MTKRVSSITTATSNLVFHDRWCSMKQQSFENYTIKEEWIRKTSTRSRCTLLACSMHAPCERKWCACALLPRTGNKINAHKEAWSEDPHVHVPCMHRVHSNTFAVWGQEGRGIAGNFGRKEDWQMSMAARERKFFVGGNWKMNGTKPSIDGIVDFLKIGPLSQDSGIELGIIWNYARDDVWASMGRAEASPKPYLFNLKFSTKHIWACCT